MMPKFATLLGYTQGELEFYFRDYLESAAQCRKMGVNDLLLSLQSYYPCFCFDEDASVKLYSPLDINNFLAPVLRIVWPFPIHDYWMDAVGDLQLLRTFMERGQLNQAVLDEIESKQVVLERSDLINPPLFSKEELYPLLALNGYLTIKEVVNPVSDNPDDRLFVYGFPNNEVKKWLNDRFLRAQGVH